MPVKPPLTHFLAIPLYNARSASSLTSALAKFNEECGLAGPSSSDVPPGWNSMKTPSRPILPPGSIRPPTTLHLTLGVMSLARPERVEAAVGLLQGCDLGEFLHRGTVESGSATVDAVTAVSMGSEDASSSKLKVPTEPEPIRVQLKGLHSMQDAQATSVLYAAPEDRTNRLLALCEGLREKFTAWGYIIDEGRELKLHATVVNTIYAKQPKRPGRGKGKVKINAQDLLSQWKDHIWADVTVDKVVIYEMGAKENEQGEVVYKQVAEKTLE